MIIQALDQIHSLPGASFNPDIHLRIKKDFYNSPVFEYADNASLNNFCRNSSYQANTASKALRERIEQEGANEVLKDETFQTIKTNLLIYPNPARSELHIQSEGCGIDYLTIFDSSSRPVIQVAPGGQSLLLLDISNLASGIYIVRAACGNDVLTEKLVIGK